eukprot:4055811-Amphidinium_carterae.1
MVFVGGATSPRTSPTSHDRIRECSLTAPWRQAENRLSHDALRAQLLEKQRLSPIWSFPGFKSRCFRMDWLHVMDIGVAAYFYGGVLTMASSMARYGTSQEARCKAIFKKMRTVTHAKQDIVCRLSVPRIALPF